MSIKLDWQIIDEDASWEEEPEPVIEPQRRRVPRRLLLVLALIPILVIGGGAAYIAWTYHTQLARAAGPVEQVAQLELQAVAANDEVAFMALQDPNDSTWRTLQQRTFGRLERVGLPELGLGPTDVAPKIGPVSLEPGGALLNVEYQFAVMDPLPGGPMTVTLDVPEFFKPTPSGWVRAALESGSSGGTQGASFWGAERTASGKRITVTFYQRDANVIEPLVPHMDRIAAELCDRVSCPQQITVMFVNTPMYRDRGRGFFRAGPAMVSLPSPSLVALPTDTRSRDELYRAFETQMVQTLIYRTSERAMFFSRMTSQVVVRWELVHLGLAGPFVTMADTRMVAADLRAGMLPPLESIWLHSNTNVVSASSVARMSLALAFLNQELGPGTVERLIPSLATSDTLGTAISLVLHVDPKTLDSAWYKYVRDQATLSAG